MPARVCSNREKHERKARALWSGCISEPAIRNGEVAGALSHLSRRGAPVLFLNIRRSKLCEGPRGCGCDDRPHPVRSRGCSPSQYANLSVSTANDQVSLAHEDRADRG
jgi:hypothetical protein